MGQEDLAVAARLRPVMRGDGQRYVFQDRDVEWLFTLR